HGPAFFQRTRRKPAPRRDRARPIRNDANRCRNNSAFPDHSCAPPKPHAHRWWKRLPWHFGRCAAGPPPIAGGGEDSCRKEIAASAGGSSVLMWSACFPDILLAMIVTRHSAVPAAAA